MTDKPQWTEEEWNVGRLRPDGGPYTIVWFRDPQVPVEVAVLNEQPGSEERARVIAEAPNLYRELEDAAEEMEALAALYGRARDLAARYRRALAKARGEE